MPCVVDTLGKPTFSEQKYRSGLDDGNRGGVGGRNKEDRMEGKLQPGCKNNQSINQSIYLF